MRYKNIFVVTKKNYSEIILTEIFAVRYLT